MARAVAFTTILTAKTRELTQNSCEYKWLHTHSNSTTIVLRVPSTIAGAGICLGCWRDRPFLDHTHLVFGEVVPMGRQEATRPDSDEDCIRIGEFPCYSHHAERLARLKQVLIFKVLVRPIPLLQFQRVVQNHQPIPWLPSLSKVFEKHLHKPIYNYLNIRALLIPNSFGFRKKSTLPSLLGTFHSLYQI